MISGPIVSPINGHVYSLLANSSWTDAQAQAVALGGNLATVRSRAEQDWIFSTFGTSSEGELRELWIGLTDQDVEGEFVWISGESSPYRYWAAGSPDDQVTAPTYAAVEDYVHINNFGPVRTALPGEWNDNSDRLSQLDLLNGTHYFYGVVEVPEPSGLTLLSAGAIGLLARRKR